MTLPPARQKPRDGKRGRSNRTSETFRVFESSGFMQETSRMYDRKQSDCPHQASGKKAMLGQDISHMGRVRLERLLRRPAPLLLCAQHLAGLPQPSNRPLFGHVLKKRQLRARRSVRHGEDHLVLPAKEPARSPWIHDDKKPIRRGQQDVLLYRSLGWPAYTKVGVALLVSTLLHDLLQLLQREGPVNCNHLPANHVQRLPEDIARTAWAHVRVFQAHIWF